MLIALHGWLISLLVILIFGRVVDFLTRVVDFPTRVVYFPTRVVDLRTRCLFPYFCEIVDFPTRVDFPTGRKNLSYLCNLSGRIRSNISGCVDFLNIFHTGIERSSRKAYFPCFEFFLELSHASHPEARKNLKSLR